MNEVKILEILYSSFRKILDEDDCIDNNLKVFQHLMKAISIEINKAVGKGTIKVPKTMKYKNGIIEFCYNNRGALKRFYVLKVTELLK